MVKILAIVLALNSYGTDPAQLARFVVALEGLPQQEQSFLLGIAWAETDFRTECESRAGAESIMQLMPSDDYTQEEITEDPALAVHFARIELAKWKRQCGAEWQIAAWNRGYRRCCGGWYKRKDDARADDDPKKKPPGWFECEDRHLSFQRKVEGRVRQIRRWMRKDLDVMWCADKDGERWPVALLPGRTHKAHEHAKKASLVCP